MKKNHKGVTTSKTACREVTTLCVCGGGDVCVSHVYVEEDMKCVRMCEKFRDIICAQH